MFTNKIATVVSGCSVKKPELRNIFQINIFTFKYSEFGCKKQINI